MSLFKPTFWQIPLVSLDVKDRLAEKTVTLQQRLHQIADSHKDARFASSLAVEDMVITDVIAREQLNIGVFTLDTGLLHQETLDLLDNLAKTIHICRLHVFIQLPLMQLAMWRKMASSLFMKASNCAENVAISVKSNL